MVFNTCAVRENADNKLYGNLSHLAPVKEADPDMQIAVGGCLAQKDRDTVLARAPWVDVVFGTHNIGSLPALLDRARHNAEAQVEIVESLQTFPSTLPVRARIGLRRMGFDLASAATTPARSASCPACAGKEVDRRPGDILAEVEALVDQGVARGHAARAERQRLRRRRSATAGRSAAAARVRAGSTAWSGCASPRRTPPSSPTT